MGVWVHWEPRAGAVVAWESWIWEDFINGAGWMLLEGWGQVPELAWVDGPVWGGLWGPLEDGLEMCSEDSGEVFDCHPVLSVV